MTDPGNEDSITNRAILEETFFNLAKNYFPVRVKLTESELCVQTEHNGKLKYKTIPTSDVIGCRCMKTQIRSNNCGSCCSTATNIDQQIAEDRFSENNETGSSSYLYIFSYPLKKDKENSNIKRHRVTVTLRFCSFDKYEDNLREAQKWKLTIQQLIHYKVSSHLHVGNNIPLSVNRAWKVLVLVNPKSGQGHARKLFQHHVLPLLVEADVDYDLHITRHADDARCLIRTLDLYQYSGGLVAMGGDGSLFEIINGIMERQDWEEALQSINLGVLPCGSGNALAKALSYQFNEPYDKNPLLVSTLNVVRRFTTPMDLVRVQTETQTIFSFLSVGWGLISDIDIESERLRVLGGQRFAAWMLVRLIGLRTYTARLSYLRAAENELNLPQEATSGVLEPHYVVTEAEGYAEAEIDVPPYINNLDVLDNPKCNISTTEGPDKVEGHSAFARASESLHTYVSSTSSHYQTLGDDFPGNLPMYGPPSCIPPLSQPVPEHWTVCHGDFVMVHAMYKSHLASDCLLAPNSRLADKIIWLCIIKAGVTRVQLLQYLLGLSSGSHVKIANTEMIPVKAFRLEPQTPESFLTVDGERIPNGPIQAEMVPCTVNLMARSQ